jgi:hypothetical protein
MRARTFAKSFRGSKSSIVNEPFVGRSKVANMRKVVVFPAPLGPIKP